MPHHTSLIALLCIGFVLAFLFGALAQRLRLPPLAGYLLAGVVAGPYTPGFVGDQTLAPQLAEVGVILLMFGVGLHFSLKDLMQVRQVALPGALLRILLVTVLGWAVGRWVFGWDTGTALVFGLALSVASTVVLMRTLEDHRLLDSRLGQVTIGWVVVEDIAMVLALVLLPPVEQPRGRGLLLVRHFSTQLRVRRSGGRTIVSACGPLALPDTPETNGPGAPSG